MDTTKALAQPTTIGATTATNATCTVTIAKPAQPTNTNYIEKIVISASAAPAALVRATGTGCQGGTFGVNIPAAAFAPIVLDFGSHPLIVVAGSDFVFSVPALGAGVVCDVVVTYYQGTV